MLPLVAVDSWMVSSHDAAVQTFLLRVVPFMCDPQLTGVPEDCNMAAKRRYGVFNHTDGVWASPFPVTHDEAEDFMRDFPLRYATQGYYLIASWKRIPLEDVELELIRIDED